MTEPSDLLASLRDDGDTLELEDGRKLRLRIEADDVDPFGHDSEFYGEVKWGDRHNGSRPSDFDGNAEKLHVGNRDPLWWQPPKDVKRTDPFFADLRKHVLELAEFGYCGYVLELLDGEDAYHRPIVRDVASLWAVEPNASAAYVASIIADLADELGALGIGES